MDAEKDLKIVITSDTRQAESNLQGFGGALQQVGEIASGLGLEQVISQLIDMGKAAFDATMKLGESLQFVRTNLDNLTGSADNTTKVLSGMQDLIDKGLFKPDQIDAFTQRLIQMGVSTNDVSDLTHNLAAAALGSSSNLDDAGNKMQTLTNLFGYMQDKGGLTVSMLSRFSRSLGIPMIDAMAKSLGMTTDQFENLKGKTAVTADMMEKAFADMASGNGEFANSINADSNTMQAKQQALSTEFDKLKLSILGVTDTGEVIKGGFFDKISTLFTNLINFIRGPAQEFKEFFNSVAMVMSAVLKPVIDNLTAIWEKHKQEIIGLGEIIIGTLVVALATIITIIAGVVLAVTTVISWFMDLYDWLKTKIPAAVKIAHDILQTIVDVFNDIVKAIDGAIQKLEKFVGIKVSSPNLNTGGGGSGGSAGALGGYKSGTTLVGENGPELVNLPTGSYVNTNQQTQQMLGGTTVNIYNPSVRSDNDISDLVDQIKKALGRENELARMALI